MGLISTTDQSYYDGNDFGGYQYISVSQIVNNFMGSYVGNGKVLGKVSRADVIFHAKRGLQELSYDTLRSLKAEEVEISSSLSMVLPPDYVGFQMLSWSDSDGVSHIIYENRNLKTPDGILQDDEYNYLYDSEGSLLKGESEGEGTWKATELSRLQAVDQESNQSNGYYVIDEISGVISFSSNMVDKLVTLEYISDGLGYDEDSKIHKFAEQAMYKFMLFEIASIKLNIQEYVVKRFRKDWIAARRRAKIRIQKYILSELMQTIKGGRNINKIT